MQAKLGVIKKVKQYKTFDEIISTVSDDKMMANYDKRAKTFSSETKINAAQQRFYLAWYAKAAHEHVNFEGFSEKARTSFKHLVEKMYNEIEDGKDVQLGSFLRQMGKTAEFIEDRHFTIQVAPNEHVFGYGKPRERTTGRNFMYRDFEPKGYVQIGRADDEKKGTNGTKEKWPVWEMGTIKKENEDILIVSIYSMNRQNDYASWKDFIDAFDKIYPAYQKNKNSRIILDVRGNNGGEDKPIDHVAKRLYGNLVNAYKRCEIKDTALSNYFLHTHGAYKPKNYQRDGLKAEDLVKRSCFSGENKIIFDETKTFYPYNPTKGYHGKIDILIDARVASAAESAYTSFYHHPNVRYIGENTQGMQQYTQGTFTAPWGGQMRVGVGKLTYYDKDGENIEMVGHKPDIFSTGKDSLQVALSIDRDKGRQLFHDLNEPVTGNRIFAEYDPAAKVDPNHPEKCHDSRKAYYAVTLDPAIRKIEEANLQRSAEFYNNFLKDHAKDVRNLAKTMQVINATTNFGLTVLEQTEESPDYNLNTNQKGSAENVAVANATEFQLAFDDYKSKNFNMSDEQAKARVVFDFLSKNGSKYTYDNDANKTAFVENGVPVSRTEFYAGIFDQALSNTNFFAQNLDVRVVTLEKKSLDSFPKNTEGLSASAFRSIPQKERMEIIYKKGYYHEMMHAVTGTADERQCDAYALLRTMCEHPKHAKAIFDVYNMQRSKIGYTISHMKQSDWEKGIACGTMTYLMPKTYKKLKWFATRPQHIPDRDGPLLTLVNDITKEPDFNDKELADFHALIAQKPKLTVKAFKEALSQNSIVNKCAAQSGDNDVNLYLENDQELQTFLAEKSQKDLSDPHCPGGPNAPEGR